MNIAQVLLELEHVSKANPSGGLLVQRREVGWRRVNRVNAGRFRCRAVVWPGFAALLLVDNLSPLLTAESRADEGAGAQSWQGSPASH